MYSPPHCPNPKCDHYLTPQNTRWYRPHGRYSTQTFGSVPRFRCNSCHITFSKQTFYIDYFAKRILNYNDIYSRINDGAGLRKIGRDLKASCATVTNRINRMARNAIIANQQIVDLLPLNEDVVLEG